MSSKRKGNPSKTKLLREEKQKERKKQKEKNLNGLLELRRLLVEEDIVTGYYEDCIHKSFAHKVEFCPCPWDARVLNGSNRDVTCGCSHSCTKVAPIIIDNKEVYIRAIDNLIANLKENPNWGRSFSDKKGVMDAEGKKQIEAWQKQKDEEYAREQEEFERYLKENQFLLMGCPPEFIKDLKILNDEGVLDLGEEYLFFDDKVIYKFFDWMYGEEDIEMNTDTMSFRMYPNEERTAMFFDIGTGCTLNYCVELNSKNKEKLLNFWSKWKKFKDDNPELYNEHKELYVPEVLDKIIECETCLFTKHCDRLFCLKDC